MAYIEYRYGLQQNTQDTDWIVDPADIGGLVTLFGAPFDAEHVPGGWTIHPAAASIAAEQVHFPMSISPWAS